MSDDTDDIRAQIIGVAGQVGSPDTPAIDTATRRGWLDSDGQPTDEGRKMLDAMGGQAGTRSVFRG